jgi:hypothetical protein
METRGREFYLIRRTATNDFFSNPGFTNEVLDATRYEQRDSAEAAALRLARSEGLAEPRALEVVEVRITVNEVRSTWQRY